MKCQLVIGNDKKVLISYLHDYIFWKSGSLLKNLARIEFSD